MVFVKGQSGNPAGKPKGIKNRETLIKEERRAIFEQKASEKWEQIIDQLPPTYIADQFMGKAPDKLEFKGEVTERSVVKELLEIAEEELKRRKVDENE